MVILLLGIVFSISPYTLLIMNATLRDILRQNGNVFLKVYSDILSDTLTTIRIERFR